MKKALGMWSLFALLCAVLSMVSVPTLAQRGGGSGSGGGGGGSVNTAPPLSFDFTTLVAGVTPSWSGDYTVTNSILYYSNAILSLNIKAKPLNLPDNSVLHVTAYMSNHLTGQPLPPVAVTGMTVLSKIGLLKSQTTIFNVTFDPIVRQLDKVVITTLDGTIIATCHP